MLVFFLSQCGNYYEYFLLNPGFDKCWSISGHWLNFTQLEGQPSVFFILLPREKSSIYEAQWGNRWDCLKPKGGRDYISACVFQGLCCLWEETRVRTVMLNRLILHGISNRLRVTTEVLCAKNWESQESGWGAGIILWLNRNVCQGHKIQYDSELHVAIARLEILTCKDIQNVLMKTNC